MFEYFLHFLSALGGGLLAIGIVKLAGGSPSRNLKTYTTKKGSKVEIADGVEDPQALAEFIEKCFDKAEGDLKKANDKKGLKLVLDDKDE